MRIAVDVRMMWTSGIGSYIRNLMPRVVWGRPQDHFYLMGRPGEMERLEGFRGANISWIKTGAPIYGLREQWEFAQRTPLKTDLFWSPFYVHPLLKKSRLLVTVHDVFHLEPGQVKGIRQRFYASAMFGHLARHADAVIAVSEFTRSRLVDLTSADPAKVHAIHNGVAESWFRVQKAGPPPLSNPYLLFVGNVKPHKNLVRLLEAYETLKGKIPHDLVLVGQKDGFLTGDPAVFKVTEKLGKRVRFTGIVDETELQQYYAHAGLLVVPSLYEGFGLPPLEAMACGCPVAVSNAASLPEVCGEAALYFDPLDVREMADRILEGVTNQGVREELARKGVEQSRKFSWDSCARQTSAVIDRVRP